MALHPPVSWPVRPLKPTLLPKVHIQLADFPYLHCSINQRPLTLETGCGDSVRSENQGKGTQPAFAMLQMKAQTRAGKRTDVRGAGPYRRRNRGSRD